MRRAAPLLLMLLLVMLACCSETCEREKAPTRKDIGVLRPEGKKSKQLETGWPFDSRISSNSGHTCAVSAAGRPRCWGLNDDGQATPPDVRLIQLSVGPLHSCGLSQDRRAVCWGAGSPAAAQAGRTGGYNVGQATPPARPFANLVAGPAATCGITREGKAHCWGDKTVAQVLNLALSGRVVRHLALGPLGGCAVLTSGRIVCSGTEKPALGEPPEGRFKAVVMGIQHACALKTDGSVTCWGRNDQRQLDAPKGPFVRLSASAGWHTCALRKGGQAVCWGAGKTYGNCTADKPRAEKDRGPAGVACGQAAVPAGSYEDIAAGGHHTCGIRQDKTIACWGANDSGQRVAP